MHQQTAPLEKNSHGVEAEQRVVNMPAQYTSILSHPSASCPSCAADSYHPARVSLRGVMRKIGNVWND
jgi:hypothetical protein